MLKLHCEFFVTYVCVRFEFPPKENCFSHKHQDSMGWDVFCYHCPYLMVKLTIKDQIELYEKIFTLEESIFQMVSKTKSSIVSYS